MKLILTKSLWGMTGPLEAQLKKIAKAGYDAIETMVPPPNERKQFKELLAEYNLGLIAQVFSLGNDAASHAKSFRGQLKTAAEMKPLFVNAQSARDSMPWDEQKACYGAMLEATEEIGMSVTHETHRGRATFTPWTTAALLNEFPDLRLTADISHWFCVCETTLFDQKDNVNLAMSRSIHIHGRVGHPEGPQVSDPRAPEFAKVLDRHERYWDVAIDTALAEGREWFTFTPEFGPPDYMPTLPYTRQPLADLFEVCAWMAGRFKERFAAHVEHASAA